MMEKVRLGDICTLKQGFQVPINEQITEQKDGYVRFIRIVDYTQHTDDIRYVLNDKRYYFVEKDDIVMVRYGAAGEVGSGIEGVIANNMFLIEPLIDINKAYLRYYLSQEKIRDKILRLSSSSTMPALNFKIVNALEIPVFERKIQDFIVVLLDRITELIDKRQKQLSKLDELVKSRFVELFGDPYINDKNWMVDTLGNYMTTLTDFSANGSYELLDSNVVMYDEPNYAIMVRTTDLESGDLSSGVKYIDESAYELLSKSKLFGGELIMNKIGSAGKIYIMPYIDRPASLGRNAFMFRFDDRLNMKYLYFLLTSDYGTKEIQQYVRGAVTKTITKESTRAIKIIVPPIELQNQFATFVEQTDKSKLEVQKSLEKLELLKKALMQKYFGGNL